MVTRFKRLFGHTSNICIRSTTDLGHVKTRSMRVTILLACACTLAVQACVQSPDTTIVGVDYYPEQWPLARMAADLHSIKHDLGADMIRIGEFMWSTLEPAGGMLLNHTTTSVSSSAHLLPPQLACFLLSIAR